MVKQEYAIIGLLGVGAIIVLVYLARQKSSPAASVAAPDNAAVTPGSYPNAGTIHPSNFDVAGNTTNLTYNSAPLAPTVQIGDSRNDSCPCDSRCDEAGFLRTVNIVPKGVLSAAVDNFNSFVDKIKAA